MRAGDAVVWVYIDPHFQPAMADPDRRPDRTASLMTPAKLAQARAQKPAASPAAWLDQMAADAGHLHLRSLAGLVEVLQTHALARGHGGLAGELEALHEALPSLDFQLLQPRHWWARTTGQGRAGDAEFATQLEQVESAAVKLSARTDQLRKTHPAESAATDRALVEFQVEYRAVEKVAEQGTRWLIDMQSQLKARQAEGGDTGGQQQVREDAARCAILVQRLDQLRATGLAAHQAWTRASEAAAQRAELHQLLLACDLKGWRAKVEAAATVPGRSKAPSPEMKAATAAHDTLRLSVQRAGAACAEVVLCEQALATSLADLRLQLGPGRPAA